MEQAHRYKTSDKLVNKIGYNTERSVKQGEVSKDVLDTQWNPNSVDEDFSRVVLVFFELYLLPS